jgi:predicted RNA binding protein YcfA (HicA-like mRNA interferase family)
VTALERSTARLLANPAEAGFSDVRRVLEGHGWEARQQGSHVHFTKEGERTIRIPLRGSRVLGS